MANKLMFFPNDDIQMIYKKGDKNGGLNVWTLNLMNQPIKIHQSPQNC